MNDFLVCVDSDGCVMDGMELKHREAFGPCLVEQWELERWREAVLERWNVINLYSMTRGINRFLGLEQMLSEVDAKYRHIEGLDDYQRWCSATATYSNEALKKSIQAGGGSIFQQVMDWSLAVNRKVRELAPLIVPFRGVKEALEAAAEGVDVAVVSSANRPAVESEWGRFGLLPLTTYVMAQDSGPKAICIEKLIKTGYIPERTLMVGDAPGDYDAARKNGVLFFPILAGHEEDSWAEFTREGLPRFHSGGFAGDYQNDLLQRFFSDLRESGTRICPSVSR